MTRRSRGRGEEGSALVLALVFITVIGLLISAVLTFVDVSFRYTRVVRVNQAELYAADGAVEAAIARVEAGGPCGDFSTDEINNVMVDVTCEPAPRPPPPPPEPAPSPPHAILTLGTDPVEGLHQVRDSGPVVVRGDVFSHSVVANESTSPLHVDGDVGAVGGCTGDIQAASLACDRPTPAPADPGYPPDLTAVPARPPGGVPPCPTDTWLVTLEPGYYDDARALSALTDGRCKDKVVWLRPGVYYFNFNFGSAGPRCPDAALCTWTIDDPTLNVVGGDPRNWIPQAGSPAARPTIDLPGACRGDDGGVQLMFGGQSRLAQLKGKVELCPRSGRAVPPITLYGLDEGSALPRTATLTPASAVSGTPGFLAPENARAVNEQPARLTADAALTSALPAPVSLTVGSFSRIPDGSRVNALSMRVVHRETGDIGTLTASVTVDNLPVAGSPFTVQRCPTPTDYCEQPIPLPPLPADKLPALSIVYQASPATGEARIGTESLDGMVLDIDYTPPALERLGGCLVNPYNPAAPTPPSCALLKVSGSESFLSIGGTVYTPGAALDVDLAGITAPVLNRGVIAASMRLKATASSGYSGPVVALPEVSTKRAVLALGQSPDHGVVQNPGSDRAVIRGDMFSQSVVGNESTIPLRVEGTVAAIGDCTGPMEVAPPLTPPTTVPAKRCRNTGAGPPSRSEGTDPVYPPAIDTVDARQSVPACDTALIRLEPGYYDDAVALSRLTTGGTCEDTVIWLRPGAYYFNFNFGSSGPSCEADPTLCTWKISDPEVRIVGGTPTGWHSRGEKPPIPGGCSTDGDGVQLIFGGQSRLDQSAGNVEMCPFRQSNLAPAIPLYGLTRGAAHEQALSFPSTVQASFNFSNSANAQRINERPVRLTADAESPVATPASITVAGFAPTMPAGSRFGSATLRIVHRETTIGGAQTVRVHSEDGTLLASQAVAGCTSFCEARIALPAIRSLAQLAGLRATYEVALVGLPGAKEELDGIELEISYTPPSFEALSGCLVAAASPCPLVKVAPASDQSTPKLVLNGTVYAPTGTVALALRNLSSPVVNDGVIAGGVRLKVQPAACYDGPVLSHRDAQTTAVEQGEVFTACVRGTPVLRARVTFGNGRAKVQSWSTLR